MAPVFGFIKNNWSLLKQGKVAHQHHTKIMHLNANDVQDENGCYFC